MNSKNLVFILVLSVLSPTTVFATNLNGEHQQLFRKFDLNKDGIVSVDEADRDTWLFRQFNRIDKNHDEKLQLSEFSAYEPENRFEPPHLKQAGIGAAPLDD
ncbi:MAG: hypothetical protein LJE85_10925 [Gammaproteobacteria bacterium]|nr:hypothetical protein [Gammaproteobacteria bacterium]